MKPKVTVMMPVYNGEKYIAEAIKSLLVQTFEDFELLIMNDGSTDGTVRIIKSFDDQRIRLIENGKNLGTILTRNKGLKECRGEYIAMLDSDDLAKPTRLKKQVDFLDKHPDFGIIGSWVDLINSQSKPLGSNWKNNFAPEEIPIFLLFHTCFSMSAVMVRKSAVPVEGFIEGYIPAEDYEIWIRITNKWKSYNLPEILTTYRIHANSLSKTQSELQNTVVNKIVKSQLLKLSINPSEKELILHRTNDTYRGNDIKKFILERDGWLFRLRETNERLNIYNKKIFNRVIGSMWLKSCKSNTAPGLWTWNRFWMSPLCQEINVKDIGNLTKFFIKCLFKKDDR